MIEATRIYVIVARQLEIPTQQWRGTVTHTKVQKFCMTSGRTTAQVAHAVLRMSALREHDAGLWLKNIYVLAVASSSDFESVAEMLHAVGVPFVRYHDTDKLWDGAQLTTLCTFPISEEQSKVFARIAPYKCACDGLPR